MWLETLGLIGRGTGAAMRWMSLTSRALNLRWRPPWGMRRVWPVLMSMSSTWLLETQQVWPASETAVLPCRRKAFWASWWLKP